jgi:hypothetical protein
MPSIATVIFFFRMLFLLPVHSNKTNSNKNSIRKKKKGGCFLPLFYDTRNRMQYKGIKKNTVAIEAH